VLNAVLLRLARGAVTIAVAFTAVFFCLRTNVNIAELQGGLSLSPEGAEAFNRRWGLDQSIAEQYIFFVRGLLSFDYGQSFRDGRPAIDWVMERLPGTMLVGGLGFLCTTVFGVSLGILAAMNKGSRIDAFANVMGAIGTSLPSFVIGVALIYLFAMQWPVFPSGGAGGGVHLVLPIATYMASGSAPIIRHARASMLDQLGRDYVRAAIAIGSSRRRVALYAFRNALAPILTVVGLGAGGVVGHAIVIETVFSWPGLGSALLNAAMYRDLAVVQAIVLFFLMFMISVNVLVDVACYWLSPKARGPS
jgi:peptide/nickel transport system permease protein